VSSCNDISRTGRPASVEQRYIDDRLSARSVHVRQALHAHRTRRLFLGVGPARGGCSGPVRHTALCQLRPIPGRHIQLASAVRVSAASPVDIRLGQVQRRHLRTFPVHRLVTDHLWNIRPVEFFDQSDCPGSIYSSNVVLIFQTR